MELKPIAKMQINGLFKKSINDIYYSDYEGIIKTTKTNVDDILEYLINKALNELEKQENISLKTYPKLISSIVSIIGYGYEEKKLSKELIALIYELLDKNTIANKQSLALANDKTSEMQINELIQVMDFYPRPLQEELDSDTVKELKEELLTKTKEIESYLVKINQLEKDFSKLNHNYLKQKENNEKQLQNNQKLETTIAQLKKEIETFKENLKTASSLKILNEHQKKQLEELTNKYNFLLKDFTDLKAEISNKETITRQTAIKVKKIEELIIDSLYANPKTNEDLLATLSKNGYAISKEELQQHLTNIKTRINITSPSLLTYPATYGINTAPIHVPEKFYLSPILNDNCFDILVVSDLHINNILKRQSEIDKMYNYATKEGIKIILNLGDSFQTIPPSYNQNLQDLSKIETRIEEFIKYMPEETGIYHLLLGGNHDEEFLKLGIDALQKIATNRSDFINLGYKHQKLVLGEIQIATNTILLHHPRIKFFENNPQTSGNINIETYLENYFKNKGYSLNDFYLNLLGHTHKSKISINNSYCTIPSYTYDRVKMVPGILKSTLMTKKTLNTSYVFP